MGTLHKHTHRPLAIVALFALLGLIGWQLPSLGSAVLAYSNKAMHAARATFTSATPEKASTPQVAKTSTTTPVVTTTKSAAADTPGQQAVAQARAQVAAARAALRSGTPDKAKHQALEAALQNLKTAAALRISEIRAELNAASQNSGNGTAANDSGSGGNLPANYDALVSELKTLGFFDNTPEVAPTNEVEPNDTAATGTSLGSFAAGGLKIGAGQIAAGNVDFWKLEGVPAGAKVWAFIDTGGTQGTGGTSRDSVMDLFASNGTTILESDDDGATATGCDTTIESLAASAIANRTLTAGGTYFISVDTFGATATINPYKLFVVVTTTSSAEVESNNTPALADSITPAADAGRVRTGSIGAAADVDFYSVVVTAGATLYVNADGDPERDATSTDVVVDVLDTNGTTVLLTADGSPNLFGVGPDSETTCITLATAGTYFIRVTHFSATGTGTYALMAGLSAPATGPQVCPPTPITSTLATPGGNFPKVSGTLTSRYFRDGAASACGTPGTQTAPIAATRNYDAYTFQNTGASTACITVILRLPAPGAAASNYFVAAHLGSFNPANLTTNWAGDSGVSTALLDTPVSFGVNVPAGQTLIVVVSDGAPAPTPNNPYELSVFGLPTCPVPACTLTCPANITVSNAANQCGATVTYPPPTTGGFCQTVTCSPASGSFFPKGTTTVTCTGTSPGNPAATCSFTVTVNDTQPPAITCPPSFSVGTTGSTAVVNYAAPAASDNCPGLQAITCAPASGSAFPVGVTTVTCTVRDAVNNSATCSFQVTVNRVSVPGLTDPLACTGPGNVLSGSFSVSNNGNASQSVAASVTMPLAGAGIPGIAPGTPLLVALPGSCVASIGSCSVVNATTISYTGTLGVGQTATISYQAQVNDGVPNGTAMTVTTTASFNGGPPLSVNTTATTNCTPVGPGPEFPARSEVSDQKPGSILFYPIYTSAVGQNNQNSRIAITNVHQNLSAFVHLFFVADNCAVSDAFICLTPNQTTTFLASDMDPGTTGYLVAVAVDGRTGCPVNFNYLIGDEYVKFASGHSANLAAEGIGAIAGGLPFCNTNSILANLRFDGISYNRLPTTLALDNLGSRADGNDTMLVLNSIGGDLRTGPNSLASIFGVLYDDSEAAFSFTIASSSCQFRTSITNTTPRTTPRFDQVIPAGRAGWIRLWHRTGAAILGAAINFNSNTAASSGAFTGGHNLHKLTLTDTGVYTVPVFPPTC